MSDEAQNGKKHIERDPGLLSEAKTKAKETLAQSAEFLNLPPEERPNVYQQKVDEEYQTLARAKGILPEEENQLATEFAATATDLIDQKKYQNRDIATMGQQVGRFVKEVNFPNFVRDLLRGVFDANLEVTLKQMETYKDLLRSSTRSLSAFVSEVSDVDAMDRLAENSDEGLFVDFNSDTMDGTTEPVLKDKDGNEVDTEESKIKAKIMDTKLEMAKEQRALLRETILMGITRLVVERGKISASVEFDIKAQQTMQMRDNAKLKTDKTHVKKSSGWRSSSTTTTRQTAISVASQAGKQATAAQAKLTGAVDLEFKSDYFKLDNFADMYGQPGTKNQQGAQQPPPAA